VSAKVIHRKAKKPRRKSELKTLKNRAWTLMSRWIRSKDADRFGLVECYTCRNRLPWKGGEIHAGHRFHGRLDYDERNLKPQCKGCNRYRHGERDEYAERLITEHGLEWYQKLKLDANTHPGYKELELKEIIKDLEEKLNGIR
jgi:hypothetical protein